MRNLKKFLALVLAMMMALSLMVTANAQSTKNATDDSNVYTDGNDVLPEFQNAVDVLTGMGIFHGNSGEFNAKGGITRAEAAAVLYRLVTGDVKDTQAQLYAPLASQRFTDVREGSWYAGYVGFAVDAGLVNGYNGRFMPASQVTGYEMLKMLLKAVGYGKNGEFTGAMWQINVGAKAQELRILRRVNTTHYANTLSKASARQVVAEMTFQVALNVPMVVYQYGWYNPYVGVPTATVGANDENPSLGKKVFGLTHKTAGVVIGNQDTGEKYTVVGNADSAAVPAYSEYAWADGTTVPYSANESYVLTTGVEMFGRQIDLYYSDLTRNTDGAYTKVYAYYDNSTLVEIVDANNADLGANTAGGLRRAAAAKGFNLVDTDGDTKADAVFNDFFGRGGSVPDAADASYGDGVRSDKMVDTSSADITSPIGKYLLISNSSAGLKSLDVVIPLNIESSQITESNSVRGVETVAVPVNNGDTSDSGVTGSFIGSRSTGAPLYVNTDNVRTGVLSATTGIIAKAALVHDSATDLNDYVMGVHINGTKLNADDAYARGKDNTPDNININKTEANAINPTQAAADSANFETGYFLLWKVTKTEVGTVIHFNGKDAVTLSVNGQTKTLNKSRFYDTAVCTNSNTVSATEMPNYALPQSVAYNAGTKAWEESYNNATYTFYLDYEGNYLGAKRGYENDFFYGTYLDYAQELSSSTFTYYLTGIDINGNVDTRVIKSAWSWNEDQSARTNDKIVATSTLGVPYRDSQNNNTLNATMPYKGFTFSENALDPNVTANAINVKDYDTNMARLNVYRALAEGSKFWEDDASGTNVGIMAGKGGDNWSNGMTRDIKIDSGVLKIGVVQTEKQGVEGASADSDLYITENTKIILVSGHGKDTLKPEIYNGISDMMTKNNASEAVIRLDVTKASGWMNGEVDGDGDTPYAAQTYFKKASTAFSQTGNPTEEVTVLIMPKKAVDFTGSTTTSGYFMGDPNYSLISANGGDPVYQYTLYDMNGVSHLIWLDNDPASVAPDTFVNVSSTDKKASDGSPVYHGVFAVTAGLYGNSNGILDGQNKYVADGGDPVNYTLVYQPVNAETGIFTFYDTSDSADTSKSTILKVKDANVTNTMNDDSPTGNVWPGIKDVPTLNSAGSINDVTQTKVRVAVVVDGVKATQIFVCWDQSPAT